MPSTAGDESDATASGGGGWLQGRRLDTLVAILSTWLILGIFLDGRAHATGTPETFFALEHSTFYLAFLALSLVFGLVVRQEFVSGRATSWRTALPREHRLSLLGVLVFGIGGLLDLGWHLAFGIESDVEALLSPTHLLLIAGAILLVSTPLRRAWRDGLDNGWRGQATAILSATLVFAMLSFATVYTSLYAGGRQAIPRWVAEDIGAQHAQAFNTVLLEAGVTSVMFHTVLVVGFMLLLVRRFGSRLAPGAFTVIMTVTGFGIGAFMNAFDLVPGMVVAGVAADGLLRWLRPAVHRPLAMRVFATVVPLTLYAAFFALYWATRGEIQWSIHVWTGAIVLAGVTGYLVSLLVVLPASGGSPSREPPAGDSDGGSPADQ